MPKIKLNHERSRYLVCLVCRNKIFGKGRRLNNGTKLINLVKSKYNLLCNYDPSDLTMPSALCPTCCSDLYNCENTNQNRSPPVLKACAYENSNIDASHTRSCSAESGCDICQTTRQKYKKNCEPCLCNICLDNDN